MLKFRSGYDKLLHNKEAAVAVRRKGGPEWSGMRRRWSGTRRRRPCAPVPGGSGRLLVNVVFVLTCVPLVTIPAAIFALNWEVREALDDKPVKVRGYLAKLRRNWGRAWGAFLLTAAPLAGAGYGALFYLSFAAGNWMFYLPFMLCTTVFIMALLLSVYLYRLLANGRQLSGETVRLAVMLGLGRPMRALLAAAWYYVPLTLAVLWFPLSWLYLVLAAFSFPCLLGNLVLRKVLILDEERHAP